MAIGVFVARAKRTGRGKVLLWRRYQDRVAEREIACRVEQPGVTRRQPAPVLSIRSVHVPARGTVAMSLLGRLVGR